MEALEAIGIIRGYALAMEARTPLLQAIEVVSKALQTTSDEPVAVKEPEQVEMRIVEVPADEWMWKGFRLSTVRNVYVPILVLLSEQKVPIDSYFIHRHLPNIGSSQRWLVLMKNGLVTREVKEGTSFAYSITDKGRRWLAAWEAKCA